jgi:hypothetical protein
MRERKASVAATGRRMMVFPHTLGRSATAVPGGRAGLAESHFGLLGNLQRVINFDP